MSRKSRSFRKPKSPPFRMLPDYMTDAAAWKSLSLAARAAFIELLKLYNGRNNGQLAMAGSRLGELIGRSKPTAARALIELELKGFIGIQRIGSYGRKDASEFFLTLYYNDVSNEPATKAFMRWKPPEVSTSYES